MWVHNYEPGDALYLFGFSRGAYTVRSLAGLIRNCGILRREHADRVGQAYKLYRNRGPASAPARERAAAFRRDHAVADVSRIHFIGVFDTVGALGIRAVSGHPGYQSLPVPRHRAQPHHQPRPPCGGD